MPPDLHRHVLARFASGVTVVTVACEGRLAGFTASSFASVSLDPPLVLVCVARRLEALALIERCGRFGVSILGAHQRDHGLRFAGLLPGVHDRFEGVDLVGGREGSPWLAGSLAWLDCRVWRLHDGGDHAIVVGEVVEARLGEGAEALGYFDRHWQRLVRLETPAGHGPAAAAAPDAAALLRALSPRLVDSEVVFVGLDRPLPPDVRPIATFREREGDSAILDRRDADRAGLAYGGTYRQISLDVASELDTVGLTAAVSAALARASIPCNVVAATRHDHLFVPSADANRALAVLRALQAAHRAHDPAGTTPAGTRRD
ncbi:MAG: flavin reductase [Vicinamibacterales bacterium]|nr:flavin reductase [Vicinamibacterales bacterium]